MKKKLFISYSRDDLEKVENLVNVLRAGGYEPWFDQELLGGEEWKQKLSEMIDTCDVFVYALSLNSVESEWCQWEFARAINKGKPILPVIISSDMSHKNLPETLVGMHVIEFTLDDTSNVARLIGSVNNLAKIIPIDQAPNVPENPHGRPALAANINDTGKFQVKVTRQYHPTPPDAIDDIDSDTEVMTAEFGLPHQYRLIIILGVGALILGTIFGALSLLPIGCDYGIDFACPSTTETPTATATITPSMTSTVTSTATVTNTPTITRTATNTATPTITSTPSLTATNTSVPTETAIAVNIVLPPTPCEAEILERSIAEEDANEILLLAFNDWLACGEFPTLVINTSLINVAGRQRSYLSTLGRDQLDMINPYVDSQNRDAEEQASIVGYDGLVEMIVVLQEDIITFANINEVLQARGIELERYTELGFDIDFDPAVNLYYLVIAIGFPDDQ